MSEKDLKIVRELFNTAKENFERDGYLAPVLSPGHLIDLRQSASLRATSTTSCQVCATV